MSWLSSPLDSLFVAGYTSSSSLLSGMNFSSAWMMSYVVLTFAFCDALLEKKQVVKALKRVTIMFVVSFVVVYFQLLRGDRESLPWVFGMALAYFYWAMPYINGYGSSQKKVDNLKIVLIIFIMLIISMFLGMMRGNLVGVDFDGLINLISGLFEEDLIGVYDLMHGTWSAVLLTPLSVAGDHIYDLLSINWGIDYLNLIRSLPPGFVADYFEYVRPIDALNGPAWEMRYGMGGTHAAVVPFMNFRMLGVFLIPAIWAYFFMRYERLVSKRLSVSNLSLLVSVVMASPHWLWYGEKAVINVLIYWIVFSFFYRVSLWLGGSALFMSAKMPVPKNHGII